MLSFRVSGDDARALDGWAGRLAVDRSELLRDALRAHLVRLAAEDDVEAWQNLPLTPDERALAEIADWGPAEDWKDWSDAAR
jgi:predicted transcriptional regulator